MHKNMTYTYTGREWDPDAQMYFYRARWYDPSIQRFISEDKIDLERNRYFYVQNRPVSLNDPYGLIAPAIVGAAAAAFVGIDVAVNTEVKYEPDINEYTVIIEPPTMWDKGIPLPYGAGIEVYVKEVDLFGTDVLVPYGINITMDPNLIIDTDGTNICASDQKGESI